MVDQEADVEPQVGSIGRWAMGTFDQTSIALLKSLGFQQGGCLRQNQLLDVFCMINCSLVC